MRPSRLFFLPALAAPRWATSGIRNARRRGCHEPALLAGRIHNLVLRNKTDNLGRWITEKRNICEDYCKLFRDINCGGPPGVVGVTFFINAHNTKTRAESRFCDADFTRN